MSGVIVANGRFTIYVDVAQQINTAGKDIGLFLSLLHRVQTPVELTVAASAAVGTGVGMIGFAIAGCAGSWGDRLPRSHNTGQRSHRKWSHKPVRRIPIYQGRCDPGVPEVP